MVIKLPRAFIWYVQREQRLAIMQRKIKTAHWKHFLFQHLYEFGLKHKFRN